MLLDGKTASLDIKQQLKEQFDNLSCKATLAVIFFNDPSSMSYLKGRKKIADEMGVDLQVISIEDDVDEDKLESIIKDLNDDNNIDGIMVDRPLPKRFNEVKILSLINPNKDIDGCSYNNLGKLVANVDCFKPCTPSGALRLLEYYNIDVYGKDVLVIGRSVNVGKPLALMLTNKNATVTLAHSKTKDLKQKCKNYDVIFLAVGKAKFINKDDVNKNTIIVDIGINFDNDGKLCGDLDKESYDYLDTYSPVPGGVGVMTNVVLMENLLKAAKNNNK